MRNPCGLLWIDEVYSSLGVALDAGRRLRERNNGDGEPPPSCMRSFFGRLCGRRSRSPNEREFETIRVSARVLHEWLSAYAALYRERGATRDIDPSVISLGDPAPHLSEQFVPVHRETRDSVKAALIDAQRSAAAAAKPATVFMRGVRGVGKSVLAATLVRDPFVTQMFTGGPSWLQLGHDYSEEDVCDAIVSMVDVLVGGSFDTAVRHEVTLAGIVAQARCKLGDTAALIVLDDACGRLGRDALEAVLNVVSGSSVVLITSTEDASNFMSVLSRAAVAFEVEIQPFPPDSEDSSLLFDSWLHSQPKLNEEDKMRVNALKQVILAECRGLPLALAMAAGSVSKSPEAWDSVAGALLNAAELRDEQDDSETLDASGTVTALLDELLDRGDTRFAAQLQALAALPRGVWISLKTLSNLWGLDERSVKTSARRLVKLSFGEYRLSDSIEQSAVRLNWYVANYCLNLVSDTERENSHRELLDRCAPRNDEILSSRSSGMDLWWNDILKDEYLCRRLCWHLTCAGAIDVLRSLLCEYSWMTNRVSASSSYGLRHDLDLCIALLESEEDNVGLEAFKAVRNCLRELCRSRRGQNVEIVNLAPILASRLKTVDNTDYVGRMILNSVSRDAKRPWLKPLHELESVVDTSVDPVSSHVHEEEPETENSELVGEFEANDASRASGEIDAVERNVDASSVVSMTSSPLGYIVVGEANGRISVWDVRTGVLIVTFEVAEEARRTAAVGALICIGDDIVVSGHACGSLRVWSITECRLMHEMVGDEVQEAVTSLAVHEPSTVVSGTAGGAVLIWMNIFSAGEQPAQAHILGDHMDEITALCILPGAKKVVSASYDGFAFVWDLSKPDDDRLSLNGHKDYVTRFAALGSRRVASSCHGGSVNVWDTSTGGRIWSVALGRSFGSTASLAAFAQFNYKGGSVAGELGARVGFPYFCTRGEFDGEVVVVTVVGMNDVVACTEFGGVVSDWVELWHPADSGIYAVIALGNGRLTAAELVTAL